jgi:hypothetical protein
MKWLISKLAKEDSYFKIFVAVLSVYGLAGCFLVSFLLDRWPNQSAHIIFLLFLGAVALAFAGRITHTLAYAKFNKDTDSK